MRIVLSCAICIADAASALPPPLYRGWHYFEQFDGKDFPQPAPQEVLDAAKEVRESAGWGGGQLVSVEAAIAEPFVHS